MFYNNVRFGLFLIRLIKYYYIRFYFILSTRFNYSLQIYEILNNILFNSHNKFALRARGL